MGAFISFDISRTSYYVTASVALKMELLVQITQTKRASVTFLVHLMARESVNLSARVIRERDFCISVNIVLWCW